MRKIDEPIPPEEKLYRWLRVGDIDEWNEVSEISIDLVGTSVDREKYLSEGPPCHQSGHPERNGLAVITVDRLATAALQLNGIEYEFFAVDCPEEHNDAHAEIKPGRSPDDGRPNGDRPKGFKPNSKATKDRLRQSLARAMRVVRPPEGLT